MMTNNEPQIKRLMAVVVNPLDLYQFEILNYDGIDGRRWIEDYVSKYGVSSTSPVEEKFSMAERLLQRMEEVSPSDAGKEALDKLSRSREDAGFTRHILTVHRKYNAEDVKNYIESYRQDDIEAGLI